MTLINFDDQPNGYNYINDGYAGLNWINLRTLDSLSYNSCTETGYLYGNVSPNRVAYNDVANDGAPGTIWSATSFSVKSFYGTAAWKSNLELTVTGYQGSTNGLGGTLVGTYTVTLPSPSDGAQFHDLDASNSNVSGKFNDIDRLYIETSGGTAPYACNNPAHGAIAIDDLNVIF